MAKVGRKSIYTTELAELICERVATHSVGLPTLCKMFDDMPDDVTIGEWRYKNAEFAGMYARAKQRQVELLVDEIITISDDSSEDDSVDLDGNMFVNNVRVTRAKLRIDTRKWLAAKLAPRLYGDKIQTETTVTIKHEDALKELE